jgi:mannosyl-oligosaccharide alpha-1,2-mannosidase
MQDTFFGSCHLSQRASRSNKLIFDRPEAIESVFILYRITGDPTLRERAWKMFNAIVEHTLTDIAHAGLDDCTVRNPPKSDRMESFWLAETLKYFYLIFSEPDVVSLDDYVLNTEAHPLKRPS